MGWLQDSKGARGLRFRGGQVVDGVEGSGGWVGPAGVVDGGKGCGAVAGGGVEGAAVEGVDVRGFVVPEHGAGVGGEWGCGGVGVGGNFDGGLVDVVGVLELDPGVVLPAVVDGGVGEVGGGVLGG